MFLHIHKTRKSQLFSSHQGVFFFFQAGWLQSAEGALSPQALLSQTFCGVDNGPQEIPIADSCTVFTLLDECELTFNLDMWDQPEGEGKGGGGLEQQNAAAVDTRKLVISAQNRHLWRVHFLFQRPRASFNAGPEARKIKEKISSEIRSKIW